MSNAVTTASASGPVADRLADGTPPFSAIRICDLPRAWRQSLEHPRTRFVAVEIPDTPWGRKYYDWYTAFAERASRDEFVPAMLLNMHDYNGGTGQREAAGQFLRSLLESGRPTPSFVRILVDEIGADAAYDVLGTRPDK